MVGTDPDNPQNQRAFHMLLAGFPLNEPFLKKFLSGIQSHKFKSLLDKMQIPIQVSTRRINFHHVKKSRYLIGVLDECDVLHPHEVYIALTRSNGSVHVLEEHLFVTRNPCLHPGDIRRLKAVECPALHHLRDVIGNLKCTSSSIYMSSVFQKGRTSRDG